MKQWNKKTAVLITCHDRKLHTLSCLELLYAQWYDLDVFLVDDGCTDGTPDAVAEKYPAVNIITGSGNLFWNRWMLLAWETARERQDYDYYLWLNDDVDMYEWALDEVFACSLLYHDKAVIWWLIEDHDHEIIYGGRDKSYNRIVPSNSCQAIHYLSGNVVLVPRDVCDTLWLLDPVLHHNFGDMDYWLRAHKAWIKVVSTRKVVWLGERNPINHLRKKDVSLRQRFIRLQSPLWYPLKIAYHVHQKHYWWGKAVVFCAFLIMINLFPDWLYGLLSRRFGRVFPKG